MNTEQDKQAAQGEQRATQDEARKLWDAFPALIVGQVFEERARQDRQWGGPEHDDARHPLEWFEYIGKQLGMMATHAAANGGPARLHHKDPEIRARMTKIAALAMAALASMERKDPTRCTCPGCALEDQLSAMLGERADVRMYRVDEAGVSSVFPGGEMPFGLGMASNNDPFAALAALSLLGRLGERR